MFSFFKRSKIKPIEPQELLKSFVKDYLAGNVERLITFDLADLESDSLYGCPNRPFVVEDTNLTRAILYVVWGKDLGLSSNVIGTDYRGFLVNPFKSIFGVKEQESYPHLANLQFESFEHISRFQKTCNTLGNLILMPTGFLETSPHGFFDLFLMHVLKTLEEKENDSYVLANREYFFPFDAFYQRLYLMDFIDELQRMSVKELFKPWRYLAKYPSMDEEMRNKYRVFVEDYLEKATAIISQRANWMIGPIHALLDEQTERDSIVIPEMFKKR